MSEQFPHPIIVDTPKARIEVPGADFEDHFLTLGHLEALLNKLPPKARRVMLLAYDLGGEAEELSPEEIAEQLDLSVDQVKGIIAQSLNQMRIDDSWEKAKPYGHDRPV